MIHRTFGIFAAVAVAFSCGACHSHIEPLRPVERVEVWVPDRPTVEHAATAPAAAETATAPATSPVATSEPATAPALATTPPPPPIPPSTSPSTQPGHMEIKVIDPNETSRFIYKATYDNIWQQAMLLFHHAGFELDRQDYRLGVMTSKPLPSAQIVEFWKPEQVNANDALENTLNSQRRSLRLTISTVPGKPDFYQVGIQVLVERETNPSEAIGGPLFVEGSGFGRNAITLRSDYVAPTAEPGRWVIMGHDPDLEHKLLTALFLRI